MAKLSFRVIRKDPELLAYSLISGIMVICALILGMTPIYQEAEWAGTFEEDSFEASDVYYAWIFGMYMIISIIVVFWNSAIVYSAHERLRGGDPRFATGIKAAAGKLPTIILWGIITGTVGLLLRMLRNATHGSRHPAMRALGWIVSIVAEAAWWIMTFFVVPMIVIEKKGVRDSLRDGRQLFRRTWGEAVTSSLGVMLIAFLFAILAFCGLILFYMVTGLLLATIIIGAILFVIIFLVFQTADVVAKATCYELATTGKVPSLAQGLEHNLDW